MATERSILINPGVRPYPSRSVQIRPNPSVRAHIRRSVPLESGTDGNEMLRPPKKKPKTQGKNEAVRSREPLRCPRPFLSRSRGPEATVPAATNAFGRGQGGCYTAKGDWAEMDAQPSVCHMRLRRSSSPLQKSADVLKCYEN